jgi:hypothetical protein
MRWLKGSKEDSIVTGNGYENQPNQLKYSVDVSFDEQCNLYVANNENHRVQNFVVDGS